jgi:hypothetical protein
MYHRVLANYPHERHEGGQVHFRRRPPALSSSRPSRRGLTGIQFTAKPQRAPRSDEEN